MRKLLVFLSIFCFCLPLGCRSLPPPKSVVWWEPGEQAISLVWDDNRYTGTLLREGEVTALTLTSPKLPLPLCFSAERGVETLTTGDAVFPLGESTTSVLGELLRADALLRPLSPKRQGDFWVWETPYYCLSIGEREGTLFLPRGEIHFSTRSEASPKSAL